MTCACGLAQPTRTVVETKDGQHRLLRDGKPYLVRGVGGSSHLPLLARSGGNSIRTWDPKNLDAILDEAHEHGLSVCVGLWLGHERHGFDYQDEKSVVRQLEECIATVEKYRSHPAVLMWGLGNEMEGRGRNPAIWYAVDHLAREVKRVDPEHPTMTVIAELGESKIRNIDRFCPHIDIVGINAYGGIASLGERYRAAGGAKPFLVTEFGPLGPWEVGKTAWGSPVEETSTAKAKRYADGYRKAVVEEKGLCLGSYAFLWGTKQETTATWFGMLLPDGTRLEATDAMREAWTGSPPPDRCPRIESLVLEGASTLKPGDRARARLVATDPENDTLKVRWVLREDSGTVGSGGEPQSEEAALLDAVKSEGRTAIVTAPGSGGAFRLFAYVYDRQGGAAVANVPLLVEKR